MSGAAPSPWVVLTLILSHANPGEGYTHPFTNEKSQIKSSRGVRTCGLKLSERPNGLFLAIKPKRGEREIRRGVSQTAC